MNNPGPNILLNANANVSGVGTNAWFISLVCLVVLLGGVFYVVVNKESHPWYSTRISWMEYLFGPPVRTAAAIQSIQDTTSPLAQLDTQTNVVPRAPTAPGETWCFLGEDTTGRWCVKVPVPSLCEPSRSYGGRDPCEMTLAQKLPLGTVKDSSIPNPASTTIKQQARMATQTSPPMPRLDTGSVV
jgi:hypothetical protein